jgi:alpha-L-rhamnosidase
MSHTPVSWSASWIASPVCGGARTLAPAPYLRKAFTLSSPPVAATLHITALGIYEAEINGQPVGDHVFAPGWTDYRIRVPYQTYDVLGHLREGTNSLGVILGDGWFSGHLAEKDRQFYGDRPRLLAQLEITLGDGSTVRVESDGSWKTTTGPILENDLIMGEAHDARRDLGAWSSPDYDEQGWFPVRVEAPPALEIVPQLGPPVRRHEILHAPAPLEFKDVPWAAKNRIYDLGQNITGRVRLTLNGRRGVTIKIRHAEILGTHGTLYTDNLRSARATDFYTLRGGDSETWEPRFTFHGFRYVELSWQGPADDVVIERVEGVVLHSDTARTGFFSCSHPLLNQLAHNILWGQKGNFLEVPTDCPQRDERLGWTGDAQVFIRTACFHMDVRGFFDKWLRDMRDAQSPEGGIPPTVPFTESFGLSVDGGPAWADAVFICPWVLYQCYGNIDVLRDHYPAMVRYMEYLEKHKVKDHIRAHPEKDGWGGFGDWLALDGVDGNWEGGTRKDLIGTAHYANNARILAQTADLLGKTEDARAWRELHARIVKAFQKRFVTPDGFLAGGTQTAYVLALHFDLLDEAVRPTAARELVSLLEKRGWHLATGFVGTPYLLHVLEKTGHLDAAYKILEQESYPSWLFPVKNGATTIWERWDGWTPEKGPQDKGMNSYNHYAYGAVGDWMISSLAGLEIGKPGYEEIQFKPRPGGSLTWAEARLESPRGRIAIRWELHGPELRLTLTVPEGSRAELSLPPGWNTKAPVLGPGTHSLTAHPSA